MICTINSSKQIDWLLVLMFTQRTASNYFDYLRIEHTFSIYSDVLKVLEICVTYLHNKQLRRVL